MKLYYIMFEVLIRATIDRGTIRLDSTCHLYGAVSCYSLEAAKRILIDRFLQYLNEDEPGVSIDVFEEQNSPAEYLAVDPPGLQIWWPHPDEELLFSWDFCNELDGNREAKLQELRNLIDRNKGETVSPKTRRLVM